MRPLVLAGLFALAVASPAAAETSVTLTPASGLAGSSVSLTGAGFPKSKRVVVKAGSQYLLATRTSDRGSFTGSAKLSSTVSGKVRIVTTSRKRKVVNFFVVSGMPRFLEARELGLRTTTRLRETPYRATTGSSVELVGRGLRRKRRVRMTFGGFPLPDARTSKRGSLRARFTVPSMAPGVYVVEVRTGRKKMRLLFEVTLDPLIAAAGDIACDSSSPHFKGGLGDATDCHMKQTSDLVIGLRPDGVLALGDTQYEAGTPRDFSESYDPTWGRFKKITRAVIGNHEYGHQDGRGYWDYFGPLGGTAPNGWYSFDLGTWHFIALNDICEEPTVSCGLGSAQEQWLRADLAAHTNRCTLAFMHEPVFTSGEEGPQPMADPFFNALYEAGADVLLTGHNHNYERFAPEGPGNVLNPNSGVREFVVGTGGRDLQGFHPTLAPNSELRDAETYGVLTLRLHPSSYDWRFVPEPGKQFTDAGSQACH
jgi:acid phosphatase type 7